MEVKKKKTILTVERLKSPFWVLHYAQNLPQNQTYPSTSKSAGGAGGGEGEKDKLKGASHKNK